jgi:glycosyltransferase involved in cell wall biosynthesis
MPTVETLYHGIDPDSVQHWTRKDGVREELGIQADAPVVGTVANFKGHKRLDVLLLAAARVRRDVPDVRFVLVGQGPLEDEMHQRATALGLDDTVIFAGFRDDAPRVAASFDVFAMSSEYEGLSIAIIEAMALGKPAVTTDVGGLPEVIQDGIQGYVVRVGDDRALAERIVRLLEDPALRSRMGEEGRTRAARFDIRRSVQRMEEVYEGLLGGRAR